LQLTSWSLKYIYIPFNELCIVLFSAAFTLPLIWLTPHIFLLEAESTENTKENKDAKLREMLPVQL
jgi:hypothetical protein